MKYDINWATALFDAAQDFNCLFFWGHQPNKSGIISKSCMSQWWISEFESDGKKFSSAEQWMMYQKALLFNDQEIAATILITLDPAKVKQLGRKVKGFDENIWKSNCYDIVVEGNSLKFGQEASLREYLLSTGDKILVEASPYDKIWGIGMKSDAEGIDNPYNWRGQNFLGFALMEVRDRLKSE